MSDIVWGTSDKPELCKVLMDWTAAHIWPDDPSTGLPEGLPMGVFDAGKLVGCVHFHDWDPRAGTIEISAASSERRWLTRSVLDTMFRYAFKTARVQLLVARVSAHDRQKHLHRILRTYGFKDITIPRLFGRDEDGILFMLTDDDWKASKFYREKDR